MKQQAWCWKKQSGFTPFVDKAVTDFNHFTCTRN